MEKIVFDNGLTVAMTDQPEAHSAAVSFFIASGNRFETLLTSGISHFIEHMVFKGTSTRTVNDIAEESDMMGGQLNAYTAKEYTCFYSRALTEHVPATLDLICDMICNPLFDKKDMETEKGVILEEIGMYEDSPEDYCSDALNSLCYAGRPLGFNILGTRETVAGMTPEALRSYMFKNYVPERTVISLCGKFDRDAALETIERYFGGMKNTGNPIKFDRDRISGGFALCGRDCEQTQISFCFNGLPSDHPLKYDCSFFSSIAGGASSSRINRRIREELGLAYSAYTFSSSYLGTGMFGVSAGLAHQNQEKFLTETLKILDEVKININDDEIRRTKEQFKAGIVLSNENMSAIAASVGRQLLFEGRYIDIDGVLDKINAVTAESVREAAALVTDRSTVAVSVVGDAREEEFYRDILNRV